ncbi:Rare lipoprotein A precursor [Tsuneonella dongtanensis]|uniref:Rare lipoprotein A n=1 Tax=Tsuneonella dongtanensis TaxID=692370 RepID=A0A1B2AES5_9SPHN|nr:SPOR domain-containing protein [Tsuneonella dongtanensis]ANY20652.1 Rare lipoprotein A precursor [Tsuneonella dongtanensis]
MRLSVDAGCRLFALGLTAATLAGCGLVGNGGDRPQAVAVATDPTGPAADYPMVLGDPYSVEGVLYTPADTMNYDVVGYAAIDAGQGVTVAHRTLPLPSYVEVTSLSSGKTILARVERRGPMTGTAIIALAPAAAAQLAEDAGGAIRLRRVNPPEKDRIELRAGRAAPDRIETPKSLVEVLRRKLPASGAASLRAPAPARPALAAERPQAASVAKASAELAPVLRPATTPAAVPSSPAAVAAYPLQPLAGSDQAAKPVVVARTEPAPVALRVPFVPEAAAPIAKPATPKAAAERGAQGGDGFVVQAGAFSNRTSAQRVAEALGGYVSPTGKLFRVRTGPFTSRGQAEAALAKVRAAGYSDARVYTAG